MKINKVEAYRLSITCLKEGLGGYIEEIVNEEAMKLTSLLLQNDLMDLEMSQEDLLPGKYEEGNSVMQKLVRSLVLAIRGGNNELFSEPLEDEVLANKRVSFLTIYSECINAMIDENGTGEVQSLLSYSECCKEGNIIPLHFTMSVSTKTGCTTKWAISLVITLE